MFGDADDALTVGAGVGGIVQRRNAQWDETASKPESAQYKAQCRTKTSDAVHVHDCVKSKLPDEAQNSDRNPHGRSDTARHGSGDGRPAVRTGREGRVGAQVHPDDGGRPLHDHGRRRWLHWNKHKHYTLLQVGSCL